MAVKERGRRKVERRWLRRTRERWTRKGFAKEKAKRLAKEDTDAVTNNAELAKGLAKERLERQKGTQCSTSEAFVYTAMVRLMVRRLACV